MYQFQWKKMLLKVRLHDMEFLFFFLWTFHGILLPDFSNFLWEKNVLVIEKNFLGSVEQFIRTVKGQYNVW